VKNYQKMEICNLSADSLTDASSSKKRWEMTASDGCWKKRVNAGGCRNYLGRQRSSRLHRQGGYLFVSSLFSQQDHSKC